MDENLPVRIGIPDSQEGGRLCEIFEKADLLEPGATLRNLVSRMEEIVFQVVDHQKIIALLQSQKLDVSFWKNDQMSALSEKCLSVENVDLDLLIVTNPERENTEGVQALVRYVRLALDVVIESEKNPQLKVIMNVPSSAKQSVIDMIDSKQGPTISVVSTDWCAMEIIVSEKTWPKLRMRLLQLGVNDIQAVSAGVVWSVPEGTSY